MMGRPPWYAASSRTLLHADRVPRSGPAIIAPNHLSPFDIPALMGAAPRPLDFVSIPELMNRPLVGQLFRGMNAFPLDRGRPDAAAVRTFLQRLEAGRIVVVFPEGRIRKPEHSILNGHPINPNIVRLGRLSGAPIIPCVLLGTARFWHPLAWLPTGQTRYAVAFGEGIHVTDESAAMVQLRSTYDETYAQATRASGICLLRCVK